MYELLLLAYYYLNRDSDKPDLSLEDRRRRDRRTPRIAIRSYSQSGFSYLFGSGNDQALLNCCGVDHVTFRELLGIFEPMYDRHTIDRETGLIKERSLTPSGVPIGRPRDLDGTGALGLVLYWFRTKGTCTNTLGYHFGLAILLSESKTETAC